MVNTALENVSDIIKEQKQTKETRGVFFLCFFNKQEQTTLFCTTAANGDLSFQKKYEYLDLCVHNTYTYLLSCGDKTLFYGDLVR